MTSTAPGALRLRAASQLHLRDFDFFIHSIDRPNIKIVMRPRPKKIELAVQSVKKQIVAVVQDGNNGKAIVYCLSKNEVATAKRVLSEDPAIGHRVEAYTARLDRDSQKKLMDRFGKDARVPGSDAVQIMVATSGSFGLGINMSSVRLIVHLMTPETPNLMFQLSGRAGRDGRPAQSLVLYDHGDIGRWRSLANEERATSRDPLDAYVLCAESTFCRRAGLLAAQGEPFDARGVKERDLKACCTVCERGELVGRVDVTDFAQSLVRLAEATADAFLNAINSNGWKLTNERTKKVLPDFVELALGRAISGRDAQRDWTRFVACDQWQGVGCMSSWGPEQTRHFIALLVECDVLTEVRLLTWCSRPAITTLCLLTWKHTAWPAAVLARRCRTMQRRSNKLWYEGTVTMVAETQTTAASKGLECGTCLDEMQNAWRRGQPAGQRA